jgi:hypothetical protein
MPDDRFQMSIHDDERSLGDALRALPLATPTRSAWAELERELAVVAKPAPGRGRQHSRVAWLALAATFVLAVVGVRWFGAEPGRIEPAPSGGASADTLALIAQSQELDAVLAALDARSMPLDAGSAMASAELENLIGLTDLQLNAATHDDEAQALWSRRVDLMTRLAEARTRARFDALSDSGGASLQNASYRID